MNKEKTQAISTDSLMTGERTFPPSDTVVARAHINARKYGELYEKSINDPDSVWIEQAGQVSCLEQAPPPPCTCQARKTYPACL